MVGMVGLVGLLDGWVYEVLLYMRGGFFTLNRYFYPSTSSTPNVHADSSS